ncbi:MAG: DUF1059 domain-containing protein [Candidatus Kariarchaeaceae archaeon]|jgi:predicted small metal-binding protein
MTKEFHCRDVGFDCDGIVQGQTEDELMNKVAIHAKEVHNITDISDDVVNQVKAAVREV